MLGHKTEVQRKTKESSQWGKDERDESTKLR